MYISDDVFFFWLSRLIILFIFQCLVCICLTHVMPLMCITTTTWSDNSCHLLDEQLFSHCYVRTEGR
jgi:hypothetical protein